MTFFAKYFITDRAFYKRTLIFILPIVVQSLITIGVNQLSTVFLSGFGEAQISASSFASSYIEIYNIICCGLGGGAMVLSSQYWGSGDKYSFRRVTSLMTWATLLFGLLFMLAAMFIPELIMNMYTSEEDVVAYGVRYLRQTVIIYPFYGMSLTLSQMLYASEQSRIPLYGAIAAFVFNILVSWVFIYGNLGAPPLEIAGAALALCVSRVVEFVVVGGYFLFIDRKVGFRIKDLFLPMTKYVKVYIKFSLPVLISDSLLAVGNNMLAVIIGHMGKNFSSANSIVSLIMRVTTAFNTAVGRAGNTLTGQAIGEGDMEKTKKQASTFHIASIIIGFICAAIIFFIAPSFIDFFNVTDETKAIARQLLNALAFILPFQTCQYMLGKGILRGGGDTKFLMIADILFLWLVSLPLGYLTAYRLNASPFTIYISLYADYIIKAVWLSFRLKSGKWIHPVEKAARKTPEIEQTRQQPQ